MTGYTIVIEDADTNFYAYVIGLDDNVATGRTIDEVTDAMREAIPFHVEGMRISRDSLILPLPLMKTIQIDS